MNSLLLPPPTRDGRLKKAAIIYKLLIIRTKIKTDIIMIIMNTLKSKNLIFIGIGVGVLNLTYNASK